MNRILIVDDEESICFSMSEYFTMHGYEVNCAQGREEAESLLATDDYDVVIEDLRLGGLHSVEGLEIVELIRREYPATRIIVLTAYGSSEMEKEAKTRGADAFLRKPKPLSDVAQVVYGLVGSGRLAVAPGPTTE
jgi:DNA-binding NtrC family response regulator